MKILAIDTATPACSVAVLADGAVAGMASEVIGTGHAERLFPMIGDVLGAAGLSYDDLDGLGVTRGPGSFTGVRVGLSVARGLALAKSLPLAGVTTLAALAASVAPERHLGRPILACLDARRGQVYFEPFSADGGSLAPASAVPASRVPEIVADAVTAPDQQGVVLAGTGADQVMAELAAARIDAEVDGTAVHPDPAAIARLAAAALGADAAPPPVAPYYLRGAGAALASGA